MTGTAQPDASSMMDDSQFNLPSAAINAYNTSSASSTINTTSTLLDRMKIELDTYRLIRQHISERVERDGYKYSKEESQFMTNCTFRVTTLPWSLALLIPSVSPHPSI